MPNGTKGGVVAQDGSVLLDDKGVILPDPDPNADLSVREIEENLGAAKKTDVEGEGGTDGGGAGDEPRRGVAGGRDDDDLSDDQVADANLSEEEREQVRERRRRERKVRKDRQRQHREASDRYIGQLEEQLQTLAGQVEALSQRQTGTDMARLDSAIQDAHSERELAGQTMAAAFEAKDHFAHAEATKALVAAERKFGELSNLKTRLSQGQVAAATRDGRVSNPQVSSPQSMSFARQWMRDNPWYKPNRPDEASQIVLAIDAQLMREKFNPNTQEYWDELSSRASKRLPEFFEDSVYTDDVDGKGGRERTAQPRRRQITGGSARESAVTGGGKQFRLSAERVTALKEAGFWDDPAQRAKMIKRYQEQDAADAAARRQR